MLIALVGNQNCGKTTLFNALTGSNQHVGNFPGVTIDSKMGVIKNQKHEMKIVDLPVFIPYHHILMKKLLHVISSFKINQILF